MSNERKTLGQLFVPIALETLFHMMAGMVDTLMLSTLNDQAVGAVGTCNTYISVFIITFNIISSGMIAVMTQYIGAGRPGVAYQARRVGMVFNMITGVCLSSFLIFCSGGLLAKVGVADALFDYALVYIRIVGGCIFINALMPIFSNYLRAFGHTKQPMIATIVANIVNILLNAFFLFVVKWGVAGVALATVISRLVNLVILLVCSFALVKIKKDSDRIENREIVKQILKVGLPSAMETAFYNIAMTMTVRFLNQMDPDGVNVTARSYTMQITNFSFCAASALAQANAILTGWRIGAHDYDACDKGTRKAALMGIGVAVGLETIFAITGKYIFTLFTDDPVMLALIMKLLVIDIALEAGRAANLVYGQALKTSGDALFTTILGLSVMYIFMVGGTYLFGIRLELMAVGAYIGMASDECVRALGMFLRWKSGKWRTKGFIKTK